MTGLRGVARGRRFWGFGLAVVLVVGVAVGLALQTERAQGFIFTVDTFADQPEMNAGNGVCEAMGGGCSLRAAVQESNASMGSDSINLQSGIYTLSIAGANENSAATGDLDILATENIRIVGAGMAATTISASGIGYRVFQVFTSLMLEDLNVEGAVTDDGGGIWNTGMLRMFRVRVDGTAMGNGGGLYNAAASGFFPAGDVVAENSSIAGQAGMDGGGLWNGGTADLDGDDPGVFFVGGTATNGGAIWNGADLTGNLGGMLGEASERGGEIYNTGTMTLGFWGFGFSSAGVGGGAIWNGGMLSLVGVAFADNVAPRGGAIENGAGGNLLVVASLFKENEANGVLEGGGAILNAGGVLELRNSTVSGNTSAAAGGGVSSIGGTLTITDSTIAANVAVGPGGGIAAAMTAATLRNTIVAGNSGTDCNAAVPSLGYNLDGDGSCGLAGPGDLPSTNPLLGPLADNGENYPPIFPAGIAALFETHALLPGSPAINAGDPGGATTIDARGFPQLGVNDMGSYEYQSLDTDGDLFDPVVAGGTDCDDTDAGVFPGAPEVPGDGVDQDCDGVDEDLPEEKKEEPKAEEEMKPPEEEMKPVEEEEAPSALVLRDGGQFVFWEFVPVRAGEVFGTVKIAWLWNADVLSWTSFIPVLGVVNFEVVGRAFLWVVSEGEQTIVIEG